MVVWTPAALDDRHVIFDFIEARDPRAALELDEQISKKAQRLENYPNSGRPGRVVGTRELVAHQHYVLVYDVLNERNTMRILRVLHTARQWP